MESVLVKANLVILSTGQYWLIFNGEKGMSDCEGHGHKAVVYKSHFPPLRHSVVTETPADTLAYKPHLHTKTRFILYAPMTLLGVIRWFKCKTTYTITHGNLLSAIWDTSHWTSFVKFGLKTA